jgi:hypothetical protein
MPAPLLRHDRPRHFRTVSQRFPTSVTLISLVQKLAIEPVKLQILISVVEPSGGAKVALRPYGHALWLMDRSCNWGALSVFGEAPRR